MRENLILLMPECELIKDSVLREKTIVVWEDAVREGSWTLEDLKEMPFTLLLEQTSINLIDHTRAVTLCSLHIAEVMEEVYDGRIPINKDYLLSGSILHDVGKLFEYTREGKKFVKSRSGNLLRHPISGAAFASKHDMPEEILHIIAAHSREGDGARRTVEAVIVNHADFVNFESLKI
ncbi:MAG: HD domain-containing protein [Candidatus Aminicenantes bacterium]|nr:HD domain-containing protein [Candidatus Aminicenantes bacterium]